MSVLFGRVPLPPQAHEESAKAVQYYNECQQMGAERQQLLGERQQLLAAAEKRNGDWQQLKAKYIQKSSTLKEVGWIKGYATTVRRMHALFLTWFSVYESDYQIHHDEE